MLTFKTSKADADLIDQIVDRIEEIANCQGVDYPRMSAYMDVTACHANGCALDLQRLLTAPPFDFSHDVSGIARHINRTTGKLEGCFLPRCTMPEKVTGPTASHAI